VIEMFPWRRKRWPFDFYDDFFSDKFFSDWEEEIREIEENMMRIFDEARKISKKNVGKEGPFIYGFSMRIGPDGKPHIEEFGNIPETKGSSATLELSQREPLTDVIEGDEEISVVAEIPGVEKEDINLEVSEDERSLIIDVDTPKRKYHKELELPCKVKSDSAKATYKNGVLEVKLKRAEEKKKEEKKGIRINVE